MCVNLFCKFISLSLSLHIHTLCTAHWLYNISNQPQKQQPKTNKQTHQKHKQTKQPQHHHAQFITQGSVTLVSLTDLHLVSLFSSWSNKQSCLPVLSLWTLTLTQTLSITFQHLPPNSARNGYATEGSLFITVQLCSCPPHCQHPLKGLSTNN